MRSVTYSMGVSLDGYIAGPDGDITAPPPDEEVFRFVTDEIRQVGVHLLGRKLYETMLYWETADQDPSLDDARDAAARRASRGLGSSATGGARPRRGTGADYRRACRGAKR